MKISIDNIDEAKSFRHPKKFDNLFVQVPITENILYVVEFSCMTRARVSDRSARAFLGPDATGFNTYTNQIGIRWHLPHVKPTFTDVRRRATGRKLHDKKYEVFAGPYLFQNKNLEMGNYFSDESALDFFYKSIDDIKLHAKYIQSSIKTIEDVYLLISAYPPPISRRATRQRMYLANFFMSKQRFSETFEPILNEERYHEDDITKSIYQYVYNLIPEDRTD